MTNDVRERVLQGVRLALEPHRQPDLTEEVLTRVKALQDPTPEQCARIARHVWAAHIQRLRLQIDEVQRETKLAVVERLLPTLKTKH